MPTIVAELIDLQPISLEEILACAELQTRLDRKYILHPAVAASAVAELAAVLRRLEIDGLHDFRYETTYFDTPALDSYHGGAFGRRRRFKVRTRSYLDSAECLLEVKTVAGRGHTVKERTSHPLDQRDELGPAAAEFLVSQGFPWELTVALRPTLVTGYRRTTLVDVTGARVTMDTGLVCRSGRGVAGIGGWVLVETKSPGAATPFDRLLWAGGHRPVQVSKYGTGLAAVDRSLPSNKWHRTLARYFESAGPDTA